MTGCDEEGEEVVVTVGVIVGVVGGTIGGCSVEVATSVVLVAGVEVVVVNIALEAGMLV